MIRALTTAATGLEAQQANIDRISNDLANVNTDGYKRSRVDFEDLMYETEKEAGAQLGEVSQSPTGIQYGKGVKVGSAYKIFEQGTAKTTYHPYDMMVDGKGFFVVQLPNGSIGYTRNGAFKRDQNGLLGLVNGAKISPAITVPANATGLQVSPTGEVKVKLPEQDDVVIGQVQLAYFQNEQGLSAEGSGIYKPSLASGAPIQGLPGENGIGYVMQGALEGSNVNVANSMVEMISAQRGYEMGTKVMKTADEMLGATVNLK